MKPLTLLLATLCLLVVAAPPAAVAFTGDWGIVLEGSGSQVWVRAVTTDGFNEIYIAGEFKGTISVAGGPSLTSGSPTVRDVFVAKLKQNGIHLWSLSGGGASDDLVADIDANASGEVAVVGYTPSSTVDFGGGSIAGDGLDDAFVAVYSTNGVHQWSRLLGGINNDQATSVAVGSSGKVFVAGSYEGKVDFGTGAKISVGQKDWFLVRIDGGVTALASSFGGSQTDFAPVIALDSSDRIALAGRFNGTLDLGNGPLVSAGGQDIAVAFLDGVENTPDWSLSAGGTGTDIPSGIAVDANGVYVTGGFAGGMAIGGGGLTSAGSTDGFVAAWKTDGAFLWAESFGGPEFDFGNRIVQSGSQLYVAATFEDLAEFGPFEFYAQAGLDAALLELDTVGNWDSMLPGRGSSFEFGSDVAVSTTPVLVGSMGLSMTWGGLGVNATFGGGGYVVKMGTATVGVADAAIPTVAPLLGPARPNPTRTGARFALRLPEGARLDRARILDVTGRRVRDLGGGAVGEVRWDGFDESGRRVAPGVYFLRVRTADGVHQQRVTVLR